MLQQCGNVVLHGFELIELQVGIYNRKQVARPRLFVDENSMPVANQLFLHLEQSFAFEHRGKDVSRRDVLRIVQLDYFAQERFGGFLLYRIAGRGRSFVHTAPIRDKPFAFARAVAELLLPASLAHVQSSKGCLLVEKEGVIVFLVVKGPVARPASVGPRLNVPVSHQREQSPISRFDKLL